MPDLLTRLNTMKRPRLLINAARIGMSDYCRDAHLSRHLGTSAPSDCRLALSRLMDIEDELNAQREARTAGYSIARHVEVLVAMMNEARDLRAMQSVGPCAV